MATLEKIRSKAVLLIVVVGLAMAAFILGDLFKSGSSFMGQSQREIADINGHSVMIDEFQQRIEDLSNIYKQNNQTQSLDQATTDQIYEQVWTSLVREKILGDEYEDLGLAVSEEELFDMVQGNNLHPIVRQMFANPETGVVDRSLILNFLKQYDADASRKAYWLFIENEIIAQRLNEKYNTLIAKGLYANSKEAEMVVKNSGTSKSIEYFTKAYSSVSDSSVIVKDSEVEAYYNKNIESYKQEASRSVEYITFDIIASDNDDENTKQSCQDAANDILNMTKEEEVARYINLNSDVRYNGLYVSKIDVEARLKDFVDGEVGEVFGPYKENNAYTAVKLLDVAMRPDSMQASHILLRSDDPKNTAERIDSIETVLKKNKGQFAAIALKYSQDPGSAQQGGSLDWFRDGTMVKPFNDACVNAKKGEIVKAVSQYGTHIILVNDKSPLQEKVLLAKVVRNIEASTETYRDVYANASKFIGENNTFEKYEAAISENNALSKKVASNLKVNDKKVNNMDDSREMVRWAFKSEVGTLSPIFEFGDKFVIAALTQIKEEGYQPVSSVSGLIKAQVIKDKKAEIIIAEIKAKQAESQTLSSLAQKVGSDVKQADNVSFNSYFIQGVGYEPALIGSVVTTPKDEISEPVKGTTGVYVFRVVGETETGSALSLEDQKQQIAQGYSYRVNFQPFNALRDKAEIEDNRARFY